MLYKWVIDSINESIHDLTIRYAPRNQSDGRVSDIPASVVLNLASCGLT